MTEISEEERALWRDCEGFSLPTEAPPGSGTWHVVGIDDCSHAVHCNFVQRRGILPCSCDATRRDYIYTVKDMGEQRVRSWWYRCWIRWQEVRVSPHERRERVPWPVEGPDGEPWVEGRDYRGLGLTDPLPGLVATEWGVRSPWGMNPVTDKAMAREIRGNMQRNGHEATVLWRGVTDWQEDDND